MARLARYNVVTIHKDGTIIRLEYGADEYKAHQAYKHILEGMLVNDEEIAEGVSVCLETYAGSAIDFDSAWNDLMGADSDE